MILRPKTSRLAWLVVPLAAVLSATAGSAQQTVPFRGSNPVAPTGIPAVPLPDTPVIYDTAEGQRIRVVVVARGLANPWSLAFLPDGHMLLTERPGRLRIIRNGVLDPQPIVAGVPAVRAGNFSGLMDVVLHPRFAENQFVYLSYNKPVNEKQVTLGLARGRWNGSALTDVKDIFVAGPGTSDASRLAFAPDGTLFMSTGGGGDGAQNPATHGGKVLRLKDDGSVPPDNPFVGRPNHAPEVYSLGHRNSLGLAIHPATGDLWQHEQGPNGGDEMNVIRPGANYGWPLVSYGRTYAGPWQSAEFWRPGFERRWCSGSRPSRCPGWPSTRAIGSRSGRAMCSSAVCGRARFQAPVISSASCSTRRWRSCAANRCSSICASGSATCVRGPTGCYTS